MDVDIGTEGQGHVQGHGQDVVIIGADALIHLLDMIEDHNHHIGIEEGDAHGQGHL